MCFMSREMEWQRMVVVWGGGQLDIGGIIVRLTAGYQYVAMRGQKQAGCRGDSQAPGITCPALEEARLRQCQDLSV